MSTELIAERDALQAQLAAERVGNCFRGSKLISEKLTVPVDIAQAYFGPMFGLHEGRVVAKLPNGNFVMSGANPGEPADFDEALETLLSQCTFRDQITRATGASGGGAPASWAPVSKPIMHRGVFDGLAPVDRAGFVRSGGRVVD